MRPRERLGLAHIAYYRAVTAARADPTPAAWRRLVTAGRNLREARRDGERRTEPAAPRAEGEIIRFGPPLASAPEGRPEPARGRLRSRELRERSRR